MTSVFYNTDGSHIFCIKCEAKTMWLGLHLVSTSSKFQFQMHYYANAPTLWNVTGENCYDSEMPFISSKATTNIEDLHLLGCDTVSLGKWFLMFPWRTHSSRTVLKKYPLTQQKLLAEWYNTAYQNTYLQQHLLWTLNAAYSDFCSKSQIINIIKFVRETKVRQNSKGRDTVHRSSHMHCCSTFI